MRWQCLRADQRATCRGRCCSLSTAPGSGPVWVWTRFTIFGPPPNPKLDFGFGSAPIPNFELDLSLVHKSSGSNLGSEPDCGNTIQASSVNYLSIYNIQVYSRPFKSWNIYKGNYQSSRCHTPQRGRQRWPHARHGGCPSLSSICQFSSI